MVQHTKKGGLIIYTLEKNITRTFITTLQMTAVYLLHYKKCVEYCHLFKALIVQMSHFMQVKHNLISPIIPTKDDYNDHKILEMSFKNKRN